jgi:hypothetical protein
LSGGKDSTAMAVLLNEREPRTYEYVFTPTGDELPEMLEHWARLADLLGTPLTPVTSGYSLQGLIARYQALPNWRQRWCTRILKIEPFQAHAQVFAAEGDDVTLYIGLRADEDEEVRAGAIYGNLDLKQRWPLREWGLGIGDVWTVLHDRGITIPKRTDCARCFFQTLPEWFTLWRKHPDIYAQAEADEAFTGHTFRSPGRDTWPAGLVKLRERFEAGHRPKGLGKDRAAVQIGLTGMDARPQMCRACSL